MLSTATTANLEPVDIARAERTRMQAVFVQNDIAHEPFANGVMGRGAPGTWQCQAYGAGLSGPVDTAEVERFCAFYRSVGTEPRIELDPCAHPTLLAALGERGFVIRRFLNRLYRPLTGSEDMQSLLPHGWPRQADGTPLAIRRVDPEDDATLRIYAEVALSGFRPEGTPASEQDVAIVARGARAPRTEYFLAWFGDRPVAGGSLHAHPACALLFQASTLPAFRRSGVQAALIVARLERARALGCPFALIESQPGVATERNAARLGFRLAYTKVALWQPAVVNGAGR